MREFKAHESWTSRSSFLLASIGAAVGLGNIWKFPYITGANGGSAFVLVYLLCILFIALPILIAEINLGRMGKQSPPRSVAIVARKFGRSGKWSIVGWLGILSAYLVASYYSVIAGWTLVYLFKNGNGNFVGQAADAIGAQFTTLQASPAQMALWHGVFLFTTAFILTRGLRKGIEKAVNWMMPILFALLLIMLAYAFFEGDMKAGLNFLFDFDLGAINGHVVLMAIGHAFFSVGVAMGLMMGFGAYLDDDISIGKSALIIAGTDTAVALLAGMAIFPIVFINGLDPSEGPGLLFVSLPIAFGHMPGGLLFGTLFFLLLFIAALTSAIGVLEPVTTWLEETTGWSRRVAAIILCGSLFVLGLGTVFSFNLWSEWHPLSEIKRFEKAGFFDLLDYLTANIMMPLGGLLLALFCGWMLPKAVIREQLQIRNKGLFTAFFWTLRIVAPLSILAIFYSNL